MFGTLHISINSDSKSSITASVQGLIDIDRRSNFGPSRKTSTPQNLAISSRCATTWDFRAVQLNRSPVPHRHRQLHIARTQLSVLGSRTILYTLSRLTSARGVSFKIASLVSCTTSGLPEAHSGDLAADNLLGSVDLTWASMGRGPLDVISLQSWRRGDDWFMACTGSSYTGTSSGRPRDASIGARRRRWRVQDVLGVGAGEIGGEGDVERCSEMGPSAGEDGIIEDTPWAPLCCCCCCCCCVVIEGIPMELLEVAASCQSRGPSALTSAACWRACSW